ncbi:hypothetical protein M5689_000028 [Euphorbia peplus]|nr:hypothetical protein M5689_000028 [Euphorbia peplus]
MVLSAETVSEVVDEKVVVEVEDVAGDPIMLAKALAIKKALSWIKVMVQCDCLSLVQLILNPTPQLSCLFDVVAECEKLYIKTLSLSILL